MHLETQPDDLGYEPTTTAIEQHPSHCDYQLCKTNKASDVFEKQIARIASWSDAVQKTSTNLVDLDPFFNDPQLGGVPLKANMIAALENYVISTVVNSSISTPRPLTEVVNPDNAAYYIDDNGVLLFHLTMRG